MEAKNISFSLRDYSVALVILCGGLATRLKGYLDANMSKAMIAIEERPYLLQIVEEAHSLGIDVVLASGAHTKDINNLTEESVSTKILAPIRITLEDLNTASKIFFKTEHATKKIIADISKILEIIIPFVSKIRQNLIKRNEDIYNSEVQNMLKNISASA